MGFPEQLKKARLSMNYTQQEVADLMGITKSTYCGYETGKRQPDVAKIKRLAAILNTSGDILLETGFEDVTSELDIDDEVMQLTKQYSLLNDEDQELIKRLINSLAEKQDYPKIAADISENEDNGPLTPTKLEVIRRSLPKTPEELERQFPPVEHNWKKSDTR